mgnify:CR=1 FL=1
MEIGTISHFEWVVREIHRNNMAWHTFEISNRFLDKKQNMFESKYLEEKQYLQTLLENLYSQNINIITHENETHPSIELLDEYHFEHNGIIYRDACHKKKRIKAPMQEALYFITVTPFEENFLFPSLISIIFLFGLFQNNLRHKNRMKRYQEHKSNLLIDDWEHPISFHMIPGILMSIGIIGTFFLIYASLSKLHGNLEIENMLQVITTNIAPAFSISAFGIFFSILYSVFENILILAPYSKQMQKHKTDGNITSYVDIATRHLSTSTQIYKATNEQTETFKSLNDFSDGLEEVSKSMMKFGDIAEALEETLNPKVLGEVISSALLKEMTPVLNNIQSITSNVDKNSQRITQFLEEDLKKDVIEPLINSVQSTDESTKEMKEVLQKTSDVMEQTNAGFDKILLNLNTLENSQHTFVTNLDSVLEKQKEEFIQTTDTITSTYKNLDTAVKHQTQQYQENSSKILDSFTGLSDEMKSFLTDYKEDYKTLLTNQERAIKETSYEAVKILQNAGDVASSTITQASDKLQNTLSGVDDALVKTSQSIQSELDKFKDSYTDALKGFLDSQEEILNSVFKEQTERLGQVVESFQATLTSDVENRKLLTDDLDKLVTSTNGFVASTQGMISAGYDTQHTQLETFTKNNMFMQEKLSQIIENATTVNDNGNTLTKELIDTTAHLQKTFNDNQAEVLRTYQISVDEHLKDILNYMAALIEASHIDASKV